MDHYSIIVYINLYVLCVMNVCKYIYMYIGIQVFPRIGFHCISSDRRSISGGESLYTPAIREFVQCQSLYEFQYKWHSRPRTYVLNRFVPQDSVHIPGVPRSSPLSTHVLAMRVIDFLLDGDSQKTCKMTGVGLMQSNRQKPIHAPYSIINPPCRRICLEKLIVAQIIKKFLITHETQTFIIGFARTRYWALS